jgi:hypothetical protein
VSYVPPIRDLILELSGIGAAVTGVEATFLQSMKDLVDAKQELNFSQLKMLEQIYAKYIADIDPESEIDL